VVASGGSQPTGQAERDAALRMTRSLKGSHQKALGADKGYDTRELVAELRIRGIMPHVTQNIQARRRSQRSMPTRPIIRVVPTLISARKQIEQVFGWIKHLLGSGSSRLEADPRWELRSGCMWWPAT